ncbi:SUKH-3 domain-containing protein [Streptomyces sp. SL13]|uniref:SUKH-3 domain-containing protein n=1 Tax=Streptantibioticus silvisoli TaxID=2705255 RepID=A0AA90HFQ5_9ACTN|nr:SUKH-3 domain-containing protein [Streptantibioticus silvisoli]MDI5967419.1 SUKH-3 domain-containing protein [Streptantibioticus silvisoli]MDI5974107.1 SUKH-3 domain-containing protein [Streptantibioticus silvisoli]
MTGTGDRFPAEVATALRRAGWQPGRWDIATAEVWADRLHVHRSPGGHPHTVLPAAVEVWAEFGSLTVEPAGPSGRDIAPCAFTVDPTLCLHLARTLSDLGRALGTALAPLGEETASGAALAIDADGRVYAVDATGDWYLGATFDDAAITLLTGTRPARLTAPEQPHE